MELLLIILLALIFLKVLPVLLLVLGVLILIGGHNPGLGLALVIIWAVIRRR